MSVGGDTPVFYRLVSSDTFCRRLRSAEVDTCMVPRSRTRFGDRIGLRLRNSLPTSLRRADTELSEFKRLLMTYLFTTADMEAK